MPSTIQSNRNLCAQHSPALTEVCLNTCLKLLAQIEGARKRVVTDYQSTVQEHEHLLELAVNEAEALAWQTGFPHLLFPTLAEENARRVANWHERQQRLREPRSPMAAVMKESTGPLPAKAREWELV